MIEFEIEKTRLILKYEPEFTGDPDWVVNELKETGEVTISRAFTFEDIDLISDRVKDADGATENPGFRFHFAIRKDGYFHIAGRILGISNNVLIAEQGLKIERKLFVAERNVRIFPRIAKVKQDNADILIGGERENSIPVETFRRLLAHFPNSVELDRYASARVETIIGEFFDGMKSAREKYEAYLRKKDSLITDQPLDQKQLMQAEIDKFIYIRDTMSEWLGNVENYSEKDWQKMITKIILLIFPKYVAVLENVEVADFYSSAGQKKKRFIDVCLVDSGGAVDVIEIKKPFNNIILSNSSYRDNKLPARELSGSIMQAEKYLFHLSKWGVEGERKIANKYKERLPRDMEIHITNPKAMVILGRDCFADGQQALSASDKFDLEVIKRKYANMMDILTYDDLLRRLNNTIDSLSQRQEAM